METKKPSRLMTIVNPLPDDPSQTRTLPVTRSRFMTFPRQTHTGVVSNGPIFPGWGRVFDAVAREVSAKEAAASLAKAAGTAQEPIVLE